MKIQINADPLTHNRPLIPIFICFGGGIFFAHKVSFHNPLPIIMITILISCLLFALILFTERTRILCLLSIFFVSGALLDLAQHRSSRLLTFAGDRERLTIEGTIIEQVNLLEDRARIKVRAYRVFRGSDVIQLSEDVFVTVYRNPPPMGTGEKIRFSTRLRPFKNFNNPGRYNYESAMKIKGYTCAASISDGRYVVPMGPGKMPIIKGITERIRRPVREFFKGCLSPRDNALFSALILGERHHIDKGLRGPFNRTGLGHVLAVSGLHIGLVAWVAFFLFKWILSRSYRLTLSIDIRKLAALLTCIPVVGYAFLAGFQISSQRAMIMVLVFLWSLILGKEKELWSTLALAGLIILALDPNALFSISFQLSFIAVIGILWLTPLIMKRIPFPLKEDASWKRSLKRVYDYVAGLFVVSFSAAIFLIPIIAIYFHRISLVTIPANITVVPVLGLWVIPAGLVSSVALLFSSDLAGLLLNLGAKGLEGMMDMIRFWSQFPWSSIWVVTPNVFEICLFYLVFVFGFFWKSKKWLKIGVIAVIFVFLADAGFWTYRNRFNRNMRVTYIDVGQGNAALVEFPFGKRMLIDGGGFAGGQFDVGEMVVAPVLWHYKIRRIDFLVLSHPQADHLNGLRFMAREFHPSEFWWNGDRAATSTFIELMDIIESKGIKKQLPSDLTEGREINGVKVEVLHPQGEKKFSNVLMGGRALNNNSLVLKVSYAGKSFLFPGDLERLGEKVLVFRAGERLKSDVLLAPHHGSSSSSTKAFLDFVRPKICVISSGEGNYFGFPHKQTLRRLQDRGCKVFRTAENGAIRFRVREGIFDYGAFMED